MKIESDSLSGKFKVMRGSHKGNRTGNWVTEMELKVDASAEQAAAKATAKSTVSKTGTRKNIKIGSRGATVKELQTALNNHGANIAVDGVFGQETRSAVIEFQKAHGLTANGTVDSKTWNEVL